MANPAATSQATSDWAKHAQLVKSITLPRLVLYGVGTILGAGIFVVIGKVIGEAGALTPLAYILAGCIALTTGLTYAEMGSRCPTAGGPIDYVESATGSWIYSSLVGWTLMLANIVSGATITTGFVQYLGMLVEVPNWLTSIVLIFILGTIAVKGMKQSTWFMTATTLIGIVTLLAVAAICYKGILAAPSLMLQEIGGFDGTVAVGLFAGGFLAIYSFVGFGDMAQTAEEIVEVKKTLPLAIIIALAIVFFFYVVISMALVGAPFIDDIAKAKAPLVAAVEQAGLPGWPIAAASLCIIVNGALTQIISASRLLLDLGRDGRGAPSFFGHVHPSTRTPLNATVLVAIIIMILAVFVPLKSLAESTSFIILLIFASVNISLVILKCRGQPGEVPNMPMIVPILGAITCVGALAMQTWETLF